MDVNSSPLERTETKWRGNQAVGNLLHIRLHLAKTEGNVKVTLEGLRGLRCVALFVLFENRAGFGKGSGLGS